MVIFRQIILIAALLLAILSQVGAEEDADIKRIFRKAGVQWAYNYGSRISTTALDSGFCFSRNDPSDSWDTCQNEPAGLSELSIKASHHSPVQHTQICSHFEDDHDCCHNSRIHRAVRTRKFRPMQCYILSTRDCKFQTYAIIIAELAHHSCSGTT